MAKAPCLFATQSITFDHYDGPYTFEKAVAEFGNLSSGWNESRAFITANQCRIKLCKNALSASGGMIAKYDVAHGSEYITTFKVKFDADFEWCTGGKLGPGFFIGDGAAAGGGCDGKGGSTRLVWHKHRTTGEVFFQVYAYHADQPGRYGESFGRYPPHGSLERDQWYEVTIYVKSNTGSDRNGSLRVSIDGQDICQKEMRWTTDESKRLITRMEFATFRGGATPDYMSANDSYIYYDKLVWACLAP